MALHADARDWTLRTAHNEDEMWALADEEGIRAARLAYPSGWLFLTRDDATRELVRLAAATGGEWKADELAHELDQSTDHVERRLDDLVELAVFREVDGAYRPNNQSVVAQTAERLRVTADEHGAEDGFRDIASPEVVRLMLDALLSTDSNDELTQDTLHELVGESRKSMWMHVDRLTNLGVLEESGDSYVIHEASPVLGHVKALDAAVLGTALSP
ncbi:hypothetical protein [Haladaptatus caseinilyticus]|uniref:hypothetical protein n=1 Tax=Haladaptatus caseinilyticus TaxID=2993314 RepID=UPI00224AAA6B|nr:hypothetical protein [Haladaptatus caseinilyticus]